MMRLGQSTACPAYCDKCGQPIEGNAVYMDTRWYHSSCFSFVEGAKKRDADVERLTAERDALRAVYAAAAKCIDNPAWQGICDEDVELERAVNALRGEGE